MGGLGLMFRRRAIQAHPTITEGGYLFAEGKGDAEVFRILMANGVSSDGVGITKEDAAKVATIKTWFRNNTEIVDFSELAYFTNVISLEQYAFQGCTSLEKLDVRNVTKINTSALDGCSALSYDILDLSQVTTLGTNALRGVSIRMLDISGLSSLPSGNNTSENYGLKDKLEEVILSPDASVIPRWSFYKYTNLQRIAYPGMPYRKELNIPNITDIRGEAFTSNQFEYITNIGSITEIAGSRSSNDTDGTFSYNEALIEAILPSSVASIKAGAFSHCYNLQTIVLPAENPPTLGNRVFYQIDTITGIYVPDASVEAYKTASNWSAYADRIKPLSEYQG